MSDTLLAALAILTMVAYFLPLVLTVQAPALLVVLSAVVLMAAYDFSRELRRSRNG